MRVWKRFRSFFSNICSRLWSELFRATEKRRMQSSVSVSTHNQSVARLDNASPKRVAIFWRCTKRGAWTVEYTGADRRAVASCKQTFKKVRRIRQKNIYRTVARHNSEYVTLRKRQARRLIQERTFTSCTYTYVRRGWVADTTRASKLQFFFVPVPFFFFNASSSSQGGFSAHFAQCSYAPGSRCVVSGHAMCCNRKGSVSCRPTRKFVLPFGFKGAGSASLHWVFRPWGKSHLRPRLRAERFSKRSSDVWASLPFSLHDFSRRSAALKKRFLVCIDGNATSMALNRASATSAKATHLIYTTQTEGRGMIGQTSRVWPEGALAPEGHTQLVWNGRSCPARGLDCIYFCIEKERK